MATYRKLRRFGATVLVLLVLYITALLLFHWAPRDKNGNRPVDVARAFVEAVQSNDFTKAASFWRQGTIQNVESNFQMKFEEFCTQTFKCDSYDLSLTTRQKGFYKVGFKGMRQGAVSAFGLYFDRVDGKWQIIEDLWIPDSNPSTNSSTNQLTGS